MSTKAQYRSGVLNYYDGTTQETTAAFAPVFFYDDFLGKGLQTTEIWSALDTSSAGDTTPLIAADVGNGVARLPLDATSEAQVSGLSFGDQRPLVLNRGLVFEARVALQTLPTTAVAAVWGLASDTNAVADSVATNIWFRAQASGAILVETDDGTTDNDDVATGTTLTAGTYAIFRIDCTDPTDIKFYINGERVATGTTFSANATPTVALQPYFHIAKASGTGVGTMDVDYVRVWQNRS